METFESEKKNSVFYLIVAKMFSSVQSTYRCKWKFIELNTLEPLAGERYQDTQSRSNTGA